MTVQSTRFPAAAITDEFCPDIDQAAQAMNEIGMTGAELRMVSGKNVMDLTDEELDSAVAILRKYRLEIISIASPLLKCLLPDSPEVDARFRQDVFASDHTFEDQPRLANRSFEIAERTGAKIIRVFSFWRTVQPEECFDRIVTVLGELAEQARRHGVIIGIENEHACNLATGREVARVCTALNHPNLGVVWDPANALVAGEEPFPIGYQCIPADRIAHVHVKDCRMECGQPVWSELGTGGVDWSGQMAALVNDGYRGWLSLETHWAGPGGDKFQASAICGKKLMRLAE